MTAIADRPLAGVSSRVRENELLSNDNHWRMQLIHDKTTATKLDVNWVVSTNFLLSLRNAAPSLGTCSSLEPRCVIRSA